MKINYQHIILFLLAFVISNNNLHAQQSDTLKLRENAIVVDNPVIIKDSFTILTHTISIKHHDSLYLDNNEFYVDNNQIILLTDAFEKYKNDTLLIDYQKLKVNLGKYYYHLDKIALKRTEKAIYIEYDLGKNEINKTSMLPSSLDYDGSFSRGFSIGNKQSLSMNSNLNLQMAGDIGSGIKIRAAISDDNIPIQPEGTTQRLNEFDKVFIEVSKDNHTLVAGDYELKNPKGYFSRYFKKLKGVNYSNQIKLKNNKIISNSASFAISKGKFAQNKLKVINGNQGPYKLIGASGEKYLVILSGSEKVYLDGKLLKRGLDFDYIIDYNLAEISFRNVAINENSRIIVEFEYSDQNYLRSLQAVNSVFGDSTKNIYFSFYNEMDSKTSLGLIELTSKDSLKLAESGDNIQNARRSGIVSVDKTNSSQGRALYKKVKIASAPDSILVFTTNPDSARYIAYFSDFGENNGSYAQDKILSQQVNDRVYKWVGFGNGNYEPEIQLIPPEMKQLISLGTNYNINKQTSINAEMALSNIDKNRRSTIDDNDNVGLAGFLQFKTGKEYQIKSKTLKIRNTGKYEFSGNKFQALNPYRAPEFTRDWNLTDVYSKTNEHLIINKFSLELENFKVNYNYAGFFKPTQFKGNRHKASINYNYKSLSVYAIGDILISKDTEVKSNFIRPKFDISQRIGFLNDMRLGFYFEKEQNNISNLNTDSLSNRSFDYNYYKLYVATKSSNKASFQLFTAYRKDYLPINNKFINYTEAVEIGTQGNWNTGGISKLKYNISFRQLSILNQISNNKKPESNILGKLHHTLNLIKGALRSTTSIEFNSGQLAKPEFVFIKDEQGSYIKIEDSTIVSEIAKYQRFTGITEQQRYSRITQYNNEFERVNSTLINNSININAAKFFKTKQKNLLKHISKLSFISRFRLLQKAKLSDGEFSFPIITDLSDTSLVLYNLNLIGTLFYNRGNPDYDIQLGFKKISNQTAQIDDAYIKNGLDEYFTALRLNYKSHVDLISKIAYGLKRYEYENFDKGNYLYDYYYVGQEANIFFNKKYGVKLNYKYSDKLNRWGEKEHAQSHNIKITGKILKFKKTKINLAFSYVNIDYTGGSSNLIEYAMLDGLKDGNNYLWSIQIRKRMKNNLDLIIHYEGKKADNSIIVHQGKMQARATF